MPLKLELYKILHDLIDLWVDVNLSFTDETKITFLTLIGLSTDLDRLRTYSQDPNRNLRHKAYYQGIILQLHMLRYLIRQKTNVCKKKSSNSLLESKCPRKQLEILPTGIFGTYPFQSNYERHTSIPWENRDVSLRCNDILSLKSGLVVINLIPLMK